ncbi:MAG TPA: hypothetical protein DCG49_00890 [Ruminococcus sp.]|nr:hypothetical protein [Ruminococcus sp.]
MQIALILTGGTICSRTAPDGARRSDVDTALTVLEQHYRMTHPYSSVTFQVHMPLNRLSEDLTPDDWCMLLRTIASLDCSQLDGIIIAHGTDTLDQTAGMLSAALCGISVPVVLVSAIAPLHEAQSNGHANFDAAVKLILKHLCAGVWAVYENSDGYMYLHRGFELLPCQHDSIDFFSSTMKTVDAVLEETETCIPRTTCMDLQVLSDCFPPEVLLLRPYNGLRYDKIALTDVSAVVHGTYHSETANSTRFSPYAVQTLIQRCQKAGIPCFLAPCSIHNQTYGSSFDLVQEGAIPLEAVTLPFAYGAVWVACMHGFHGEALISRVRQIRQSLDSQCFLCCM